MIASSFDFFFHSRCLAYISLILDFVPFWSMITRRSLGIESMDMILVFVSKLASIIVSVRFGASWFHHPLQIIRIFIFEFPHLSQKSVRLDTFIFIKPKKSSFMPLVISIKKSQAKKTKNTEMIENKKGITLFIPWFFLFNSIFLNHISVLPKNNPHTI